MAEKIATREAYGNALAELGEIYTCFKYLAQTSLKHAEFKISISLLQNTSEKLIITCLCPVT